RRLARGRKGHGPIARATFAVCRHELESRACIGAPARVRAAQRTRQEPVPPRVPAAGAPVQRQRGRLRGAAALAAPAARRDLAGNQIELELTERNLIDARAEVIDRLQGLRRHGVSVAIDDFGTAYSNLSCLARLPLDCLKIDLSFVQGATSNPSDAMVSRMTC